MKGLFSAFSGKNDNRSSSSVPPDPRQFYPDTPGPNVGKPGASLQKGTPPLPQKSKQRQVVAGSTPQQHPQSRSAPPAVGAPPNAAAQSGAPPPPPPGYATTYVPPLNSSSAARNSWTSLDIDELTLQQQQQIQQQLHQQQQQQQQQQSQSREGAPPPSSSSQPNQQGAQGQGQAQIPPVLPAHHNNQSQTSLSNASSNEADNACSTTPSPNPSAQTGKKNRVVSKTEFNNNLLNKVHATNQKLSAENAALITQLREREQYQLDIMRKNDELRQLLRFKEEEYTKMQNNFHSHMRNIRATDDDLSTIRSQLNTLQNKIMQLPMTLRSYSRHMDAPNDVLVFVQERWTALAPTVERMMAVDTAAGQPKPQPKLDYFVVCHIVEKLVTEVLIASVFNEPVHLGMSINHHYQAVANFMDANQEPDWALRLRQQLCKLIYKADPDQQIGVVEAKAAVVHNIKRELQKLFTVPDEKIEPKLEAIVKAAARLSLAMHGQEYPIVFDAEMCEKKAYYDKRYMELQQGSMRLPHKEQDADDEPDNRRNNHNNDDDDDDDDDEDTNANAQNDDTDKKRLIVTTVTASSPVDDENDPPQSPVPAIPAPPVQFIISPMVYAIDENGQSILLPARVICF